MEPLRAVIGARRAGGSDAPTRNRDGRSAVVGTSLIPGVQLLLCVSAHFTGVLGV